MLTSNTNIIVAIGGKRLFSYKRLKLTNPSTTITAWS